MHPLPNDKIRPQRLSDIGNECAPGQTSQRMLDHAPHAQPLPLAQPHILLANDNLFS